MSLYRKHRPQTFKDVVGQESVCDLLISALAKNQFPQTVLFSGTHGTGKTTLARICAKALNCSNLQEGHPCNECESCLNIDKNSSIFEMDAASNRGVDDIRKLKEKLQLAPLQSDKQIFILDESHMLTKEAQNALLKVLEEPPPNIYFFFATTEANKILPTIRSRSFHYNLRTPNFDDIKTALSKVIGKEDIKMEEAALNLLVSNSKNSYRDALALLEQFADSDVSQDSLSLILGIPSQEELLKLLVYLNENKVDEMIINLQQFYNQGYNLESCVNWYIKFLKDYIFYLYNKNDNQFKYLSKDELEIMKNINFSVMYSLTFANNLRDILKEAKSNNNLSNLLDLVFLNQINYTQEANKSFSQTSQTSTPEIKNINKISKPVNNKVVENKESVLNQKSNEKEALLDTTLEGMPLYKVFPIFKSYLRQAKPVIYLKIRTAKLHFEPKLCVINSYYELEDKEKYFIKNNLNQFLNKTKLEFETIPIAKDEVKKENKQETKAQSSETNYNNSVNSQNNSDNSDNSEFNLDNLDEELNKLGIIGLEE